MSRSAEEILEFDKLRELLRGRSTCAPGKRALDALAFSQDREKLERGFALIREAREWLRAGKELGFGALSKSPREVFRRLFLEQSSPWGFGE